MDRIYVIGRDEIPQKIALGAGESLKVTFVAPPGVDSDLSLTVELTGEGAELDAAGLFVCRADEHVSIRMNVRHLVGGCKSNQLFRGVADGRSNVSFNGLVYVTKLGTAETLRRLRMTSSVRSIMGKQGARLQINDLFDDAKEMLSSSSLRGLPVFDGDEWVGSVTRQKKKPKNTKKLKNSY